MPSVLSARTMSLSHVLNNCSVSLNQGRHTWRHYSILGHIVHCLCIQFHRHSERQWQCLFALILLLQDLLMNTKLAAYGRPHFWPRSFSITLVWSPAVAPFRHSSTKQHCKRGQHWEDHIEQIIQVQFISKEVTIFALFSDSKHSSLNSLIITCTIWKLCMI